MSSTKKTGKQGRSAIADVVAREYTIHMHKRVRLSDIEQAKKGNGISESKIFWMLRTKC